MITEIILFVLLLTSIGVNIYFAIKKVKLEFEHERELNDQETEHKKELEDKEAENIKIYNQLLDRIEEEQKAYNESTKEYQEQLDNIASFHANLFTRLNSTIEHMRDIDLHGSFESDDEVGSTFLDMLAAIESLKPYVEVLEPNGNTEEKTQEEGSEK